MYSARPVCLMKFFLTLLHAVSIQRRVLYLDGVIKKYTLNTGLHSDAYELISFKLGRMIDMAEIVHSDTGLKDLDLHSRSQLSSGMK